MTSRILVCNTSSIPDSDISAALEADPQNYITFDNKYFSVSVQICFDRQVPIEEISETVEAFVYVIDDPASDMRSALSGVEVFREFLSEVDPAVKLLLINCEETEFESEFLEWCVEKEFEFIKYVVSESACEDAREELLMGQSEGMGRVRAALECHMWPYRTMKKTTSPHNTDHDNHDNGVSDEFGDYVSGDGTVLDFQGLLGGEELEGDFESMFSNMRRMKEVAGQLPDPQRKQFAEQVAMSFWRALGGSDDEL